MKKKLSFILAAVMTVCNFAISAMAAATTKVKLTDVTETTKYAEEILDLVELGIINGYEDSTFKADAEISRAEFTKIIAASMGATASNSGTTTLTDIANHWAKPYVIAAQANDIINGFEDNTFRPDDKVTYEQAVKMLVCALRYNKTAQGYGGWPNGFITTGNEIGVCDDVIVEAGASSLPTTRGVVAKLVYNALDVDLADFETGKATDQTFMNHFLKKDRVAGKVVGVSDNLTSECTESISPYEIAIIDEETGSLVRIDFTTLYPNKADLANYLGQDVVAYYNISGRDDAKTLAVFNTDTNKKDSVEVFSDDVISYTNGKLKYYNQSGKTSTIDFNVNTATVIYNKKAVTSNIEKNLKEWLDPDSDDFYYGTVTFVDNGSDNSVDVVEIMNYYPVMAKSAPSTSDYKLTNKIKFNAGITPVVQPVESVILDPDKVSYLSITDTNGNKLQPTGIKANNIALVAESLDSDAYTVLVSTKTVKGEINYFSETEHMITVDKEKLFVSDLCIDYVENQLKMNFDYGQKGTFYVDAFGTVIFAELTATTENSTYAYIISAISDDDETGASIRAYIPSKGYGTYQLADKVKIDGSTETAISAAEQLRYDENEESKFKEDEEKGLYKGKDEEGNDIVLPIEESNAYQLAILEFDGNVVKEIITIEDDRLVRSNELTSITYKGSNNFDNKIYMDADTKVIFVPQDRTDSKKYKKPTLTTNTKYYIEAYNVESMYADVILVYGSSVAEAKIVYSTPIHIVSDDVSPEIVDDDVVSKLYTINDGGTSAEVVINDKETAAKSYKTGDIIQYLLDDESKGISFEQRVAYSDVMDALDVDTEKPSDGDVIYDWTEKRSGDSKQGKFYYNNTDENLTSGISYAEASVYNLIVKSKDGKNIIVTRSGFEYNEETGEFELPEDYKTEQFSLSGTKFYIVDEATGKLIDCVSSESDEKLTAEHLDDFEGYGIDCSKIAVIRRGSSTAKVILIYQ